MDINIHQKGGKWNYHIPPTAKAVGFLWLNSVSCMVRINKESQKYTVPKLEFPKIDSCKILKKVGNKKIIIKR